MDTSFACDDCGKSFCLADTLSKHRISCKKKPNQEDMGNHMASNSADNSADQSGKFFRFLKVLAHCTINRFLASIIHLLKWFNRGFFIFNIEKLLFNLIKLCKCTHMYKKKGLKKCYGGCVSPLNIQKYGMHGAEDISFCYLRL